jgi:hypothetical protein
LRGFVPSCTAGAIQSRECPLQTRLVLALCERQIDQVLIDHCQAMHPTTKGGALG